MKSFRTDIEFVNVIFGIYSFLDNQAFI